MPEQRQPEPPSERFRFRPISLAVGYLIFGILWVFLSDSVLFFFVEDTAFHLYIETYKGILFVLLSAILAFVLLSLAYREYENVNDQLRRTVLEVSILHRFLRHDLRNSTTVILGNINLLKDDETADQAIERLEREATDLTDLADRAKVLHDLAVQEEPQTVRLNVVSKIEEAVQSCRETYPDVTVDVEVPGSLEAMLPEQIGLAITKVVENAIEHNDAEEPRVRVTASADSSVRITVEDNGPGIPEVEQETLEAGYEQMLEHSMGVDLWMIKLITENGGGTLHIGESELGGAMVEMGFPAT